MSGRQLDTEVELRLDVQVSYGVTRLRVLRSGHVQLDDGANSAPLQPPPEWQPIVAAMAREIKALRRAWVVAHGLKDSSDE